MHNLIVVQNYRDLVTNCFSDKSQYKDNSVKGCRGLLALDRIIHRKSVILSISNNDPEDRIAGLAKIQW